MARTRDRRLAAVLLLAAACAAAVALAFLRSGDAAASSAARRGADAGGPAPGGGDLAAIRVRDAETRVASEVERPAAAPATEARATAPEEPGPITATATFLTGAVRLVDDDGVLAPHREVRLLVKLLLEGDRKGTLLSVDTVGGLFHVTFVQRAQGPFALENGSREIGEGPFTGRLEIFAAELVGSEVPLGLVREERGARVPVDRLAFDLGSTDVTVDVRAPRMVTLDVVDAETGSPVGPIAVRTGPRGATRAVLERSRTSPVDVVLPSADVDVLDVSVPGYADASLEIPGVSSSVVRLEMERWAALTVLVHVDESAGDDLQAGRIGLEARRLGGPPGDHRVLRLGGTTARWTDEEMRPGTYIVTARQGGGSGFRLDAQGRAVPVDQGTVATRSIELEPGARRKVEVDLSEGAPEVTSGITLALRGRGGDVLPVDLEVSLERTSPTGAARPVRVAVPPGSTSADVSLGEWPAGRYRAEVMGGRAVVDFDHTAGEAPTTVAVDLAQWVEWRVRLVRTDTGAPAPQRRLLLDMPGGSEPRGVRRGAGGVFRFWAPQATAWCRVVSENGLDRVRCALSPHGPGVLEVGVPASAIASPGERGLVRRLLPSGEDDEPPTDGR